MIPFIPAKEKNKKSLLIRQYSVKLLHYLAVVCPRGISLLYAYVKLRRAVRAGNDLVLRQFSVMLVFSFLMLVGFELKVGFFFVC